MLTNQVKALRTIILTLIMIGVALVATNCSGNNRSGHADHPAADVVRLPTCAQIGEALHDMVAHLDPVDLVLTPEDIENGTSCRWDDKPSGTHISIGVKHLETDLQEIYDQKGIWDPSTAMMPAYSLAKPDGPERPNAVFVIYDGSAQRYEPGCEVNLTYFTPTFKVQFVGVGYVVDQAKESTLRVAGLMQ
ncbi:hypothetical protein [Arthrobacter sp. SLBN-53]|uniref:hypothetical protein n=1 Tax=Arthrobacter sp. SLBN-53 TaxID=2768412 RepID=UPI001152FB7B|nr:hypothetical protein [Arthrobacter sp. SLBN-53]